MIIIQLDKLLYNVLSKKKKLLYNVSSNKKLVLCNVTSYIFIIEK